MTAPVSLDLSLAGPAAPSDFPALQNDPAAPIAMFDSGVGGLTVVDALARRRPQEHIIYLGDQGHVPYGGRPLEQIRCFARSISAALASQGAKAIVMACNISSATTWSEIAEVYGPDRVLGMVRPGARQALEETKRGAIGVLATAGTVASRAYTTALGALDPGLRVVEVACPRFVPLVEAEETDGDLAREAAATYLAPIFAARCDTVVLGCTHYPYLLGTLRAVAPHLAFVDPAEAVADDLLGALSAAGLLHEGPPPPHRLLTTGNAEKFAAQVPRFLPRDHPVSYSVGQARWTTAGS